ncbi:MAG: peptide/nickel transport system substrate-binding protein [Clostridia bacterium]|nr:peptide/nickel transport system substrate-binding protein [Clostridia bacterium]
MKKIWVLLSGLLVGLLVIFAAIGCVRTPLRASEFQTLMLPEQPSMKKLVYGRANDSITLDPANAIDGESFKVTRNIFDTLVQYEPEGGNLQPGLATSWKVSEDGRTWTFYLRRGVTFHDGSSFNADAVKFNFDRWMNPNHPYHQGKFNYWQYVFGGFPGLVEKVEVVSQYTIKVKLFKPYAPFLASLALPAFGIASPQGIRHFGQEFGKFPVGTGPYRFKEWKKNNYILLEANDNYWANTVRLDKLKFKVILNNKNRLKELERGSIHLMDGLSPEDAERVKNNPKLQLYFRPSFNVGFLAMNNDKEPFNQLKVRLAVSYAINKEKLVEKHFAGLAKPAKSLVPPSLWGFNEEVEPYPYDPERAKQYLREAGYPEGFQTDLWVMSQPRPYFPQPSEIAKSIQEDLAAVGIEADIRVFNWETYLEKVENGEHQLALLGWMGDIADPDNFLYVMLDKDNAQPGRASNIAFYRDELIHYWLTEAREKTDQLFRSRLYRLVQEKVHEDAPLVPLVHITPALAANRAVKGYLPHITGVESFASVNLVSRQDRILQATPPGSQ